MDKIMLFSKNVLTGTELTPLADGCIIVSDGKIERITTRAAAEAENTDACQKIDLGELTLLPGMIECHGHIGMDARMPEHLEMVGRCTETELAIVALNALRDSLLAGITTERSLGDKYYIDVTMRNLVKNGTVIGPNLLVSGAGIRAMHGHSYLGVPHCGPEDIRRTVRENMSRGVDVLKIFSTPGIPPMGQNFIPSFLAPEEIRMVVEEGARMNLPTAAHCIGGQGLRDCIENGVAVIEHAYMATEADLELIQKYDRWVDLTSGIFLDDSRLEFVSKANAEKTRFHRERAARSLEMLVKGGIKFSLGTDAYHANLYHEVEIAVEMGADTRTALKGVTSNAATVCGLQGKTGSLCEGLAADIIAVDGDPLVHPNALSKTSFVMKGGAVYRTPAHCKEVCTSIPGVQTALR